MEGSGRRRRRKRRLSPPIFNLACLVVYAGKSATGQHHCGICDKSEQYDASITNNVVQIIHFVMAAIELFKFPISSPA